MREKNLTECQRIRNRLQIVLCLLQDYEQGNAQKFAESDYDIMQTTLSDCKDIASGLDT